MLTRCSKKLKESDESKTSITDLNRDELSYIFILLAQFGAAEVARLMAVCKLFSQVCKSGNVLQNVNFVDVDVLEGTYKNYQQINGLISRAAEAGNSAAQFMFAKIIMWTCCNLVRPEWSKAYKSQPSVGNWYSMPGINLHMDKHKSVAFMSNLNSKSSCNGRGIYQYRFVKMFMGQCCPSEFKSMDYYLRCFKAYSQKDSDESRCSLRKMWVVCKQLRGYKYCWEWRPDMIGIYGHVSVFHEAYTQQFKTKQELLAEFEELRSQAIHDLDNIFIVEQ